MIQDWITGSNRQKVDGKKQKNKSGFRKGVSDATILDSIGGLDVCLCFFFPCSAPIKSLGKIRWKKHVGRIGHDFLVGVVFFF